MPSKNPLLDLDLDKDAAAPKTNGAGGHNPLFDLDLGKDESAGAPSSSTFGAFTRGAIGSAAPGVSSLAGFGAGFAAGELMFPAGGGLVGGAVGLGLGLGGAYLAGSRAEMAQKYLLDRFPRARDILGQSEEQKRLDQEEHQNASFLGGIAPYFIGMSPFGAAKPGMTTLQRLWANKLTSRIVPGTFVGGMELGNEALSDEGVSWPKVAIATGMGMVFNKPTRLGERISSFPENVARGILGRPRATPPAPPAPYEFPRSRPLEDFSAEQAEQWGYYSGQSSVAEVDGWGLGGPGNTEATHLGEELRNPRAKAAAMNTLAAERAHFGLDLEDVDRIARGKNKELFDEYDELRSREASIQRAIREYHEPPQGKIDVLAKERQEIEEEYAEYLKKRGGYTGGREARVLRARIGDLARQETELAARAPAFAAGEAVETPELAAERQKLTETREDIFKILPEIQRARRHAAEHTGHEIIEPTPVAPEPEPVQPPAAETPPSPPAPGAPAPAMRPAPAPVPTAEKQRIADDLVKRLVAADEPQDRAEALAAVVTARIAAFAKQMGGALGSAEEYYRAIRPKIVSEITEKKGPPTPAAPAAAEPAPTVPAETKAFLARLGITKSTGAFEELIRSGGLGSAVRSAVTAATAKVRKPVEAPPKETPTASPQPTMFRGVIGGINAEEAIKTLSAKGDLGGGIYFSPNREIASSYGGGPGASVKAGTRIVHAYELQELKPIERADVFEGRKVGQDVRIVRGDGVELYKGPWGADQMEAALSKHPEIKAVFGDKESVGINQIAVRDPSIIRHLPPETAKQRGEAVGWPLPTPMPKVEQAHVIRSGAMASADGSTVHIDPMIKETYPKLLQGDGTPLNVHAALSVHEIVELQNKHLGYEKAHEIATRAERDYVMSRNPLAKHALWKKYEEVINGELTHVEAQEKGPLPADLARDPGDTLHHKDKTKVLPIDNLAKMQGMIEGFTPTPVEKIGMIENQEAFRAAAMKRRERGGGGTGPIYLSAAAEARARGMSVNEVNEEYAGFEEKEGKRFDEYIAKEGMTADEVSPGTRRIAIEEMARSGIEPGDALTFATGEIERLFESEEEQFRGLEQRRTDIVQGWIKWVGKSRNPIIGLTEHRDASTALEEFAHQFFVEMFTHADHPAAHPQLKADIGTMVRWSFPRDPGAGPETFLATNKSGEFTERARAAHERIVGAYMRYIYEGVAPSAPLKNVFDKFSAWLKEIYQTAKQILDSKGKEIKLNPELKAVFDRITREPEEATVIAAEPTPRPTTIVDYHVQDAEKTPPDEAEPAGEQVMAEGTRYEQEHEQPEVKAEIEAKAVEIGQQRGGEREGGGEKPAGEAAGGAERGGILGGDGGGAGAEPAGGGFRPDDGNLTEGGTKPVPESAGVPGSANAGSETERGHGLAPGPPETLRSGDTGDVDPAGNIKWWNLTNVRKLIDAIIESAERNDDFLAARGRPVQKPELWEMAGEFGINPSEYNVEQLGLHLERLLGGMQDMAPKVLAARRLLVQSAQNVSDLMKKTAASWGDDDALALGQAIMRHDMIQGALSGATASWGRTGSAFHDISQGWEGKNVDEILRKNTGRTLFQLKAIAALGAQYNQPMQITQFVRNTGLKNGWRMLMEYWINGLISGLATHGTYTVGNGILSMERVAETGVAAGVGAIRSSLGRTGGTVRIQEMGQALAGIRRGFLPAIHASLEALRTGVPTLLPGEAPGSLRFPTTNNMVAQAAIMNEAADFHDVMASVFGVIRGVREAFVVGHPLQQVSSQTGIPFAIAVPSPLGEIPNFEFRSGFRLPIGEIARAPSRMVTAIHSFFRPLNYSMMVSEQAYRHAANMGLTGAHFDTEVANFRQAPPKEIQEQINKAATDITLMGAGSEFTQRLSRLTNTEFFMKRDANGKGIPGTGLPMLRFIDPFVHISSNIIDQALIQRTPLGLFRGEIRDALMGKVGRTISEQNANADLAAAKMIVGSGLAIAAGSLAAEGYLTGSEPKNAEDAALWRQVYQAHSVRIGDLWYDIHRLGPMGMLLSTAADLYEVAHQLEKGEATLAATALAHAIAQNVLDENFMRGPSDLIKAIENPSRYGAPYVRQFVSGFVPASVGMSQMARTMDPYSRQARSIMDSIRGKVPGLSETLLPRFDVWGNEMPSKESLVPGVLAIWQQQVNNDPVNRALLDHGIKVGLPGHKIRNVELNEEQLVEWQRLAGRLAKSRLDALVQSPGWARTPRPLQHDLLEEQLRQSREVARGIMFMKWPKILVDAQAAKQQRRNYWEPDQ